MTEINNYYEALERSLKKISIILIDDFEEIKKGSPGPTISLIRKLIFNTSTIVMKNMLLRGIASHVSDKKLVIATFDLLRETIKHSPPITIDQFFSAGFATHKLTMLHKIAEYVASVDRNIVRTPQKTTIVVPNESILKLSSPNGSMGQPSVDDLSAQLLSASFSFDAQNANGWPITDFLKHHMMLEKSKAKTNLTTVTGSGKKGDTTPSKRSNSAPRLRSASKNGSASKVKESPLDHHSTEVDDKLLKKGDATPKKELFKENIEVASNTPNGTPNFLPLPPAQPNQVSPKGSLQIKKSTSVEDFLNSPDGTINYDSIVKNQIFQEKVDKYIDQRVEEILKERTDAIVKEVSEKYDFVINKLVAAVDAEFTLLNNRIKILEAQTKN